MWGPVSLETRAVPTCARLSSAGPHWQCGGEKSSPPSNGCTPRTACEGVTPAYLQLALSEVAVRVTQYAILVYCENDPKDKGFLEWQSSRGCLPAVWSSVGCYGATAVAPSGVARPWPSLSLNMPLPSLSKFYWNPRV